MLQTAVAEFSKIYIQLTINTYTELFFMDIQVKFESRPRAQNLVKKRCDPMMSHTKLEQLTSG